jgi:ABC-2 type transport system permease protein
MVRIIATNELRQLYRDRTVIILSVLLVMLLVMSVFSGYKYNQSIEEQHADAAEIARSQWVHQGEKNPHSAAHYGTFAFKPVPVLAVFDPGIDRFTGVTIFLEAHNQNFAEYSAAEDQNSMLRFGELTPTFIFTFLFPLLIIIVGYGIVVNERESGTLKLMKSQGVSNLQIFLGKTMSLWVVTFALFTPFLLAGSVTLLLSASELQDWLRFLLMSLVWLMYFGVYINLTIWVSSRSKSSSKALVVLMGFWILSTLLVPRFVTNLAGNAYPVLSATELQEAVYNDLIKGIDGHNPYNEFSQAFRDSVLASHGVETVSELPFNFQGMMLQVGEEFEKSIYDYHLAKIDDIHSKQIQLFTLSSIISPTILARLGSMGFAGTDVQSFNHFSKQAEEYRIALMGELNNDLMIHAVGDRAVGYRTGADFFSNNIDFVYQAQPLSERFGEILILLMVLFLWFTVTFSLLIEQSRRNE